MTRFTMIALAALAAAGCTTGGSMDDGMSAGTASTAAMAGGTATAPLRLVSGAAAGTVTATQQDQDIVLRVRVSGMPSGVHGAHVHMTGRCDAPDFTSAGGHWNPTMAQHGMQNPAGPHKGDLPNLTVGADGTGSMEGRIAMAQLRGTGGLLDSDGAAFIVHATADDMRTDPSGNSGARVACGVFG